MTRFDPPAVQCIQPFTHPVPNVVMLILPDVINSTPPATEFVPLFIEIDLLAIQPILPIRCTQPITQGTLEIPAEISCVRPANWR